MINRNLIRIRVVQLVYSWYQNTNKDLRNAEKELLFGLQKSYDLYYYLLLLMIEVTKAYENRVETKRNKFLPTEEDINPNTHLLENKFILQLSENKQLLKYLTDRPLSWDDNDAFVKNLLDTILESEIYKSYSLIPSPTYDQDREFWRKTFKQIIYGNENLDDLLEDECIYWNDDIEIVQSFVLKTIKRFSEAKGSDQPLLPMFKDQEDKSYALKLLHDTILNEKKYRDLIDTHTDKWDFERIALMDLIIMQVALAEIFTFESIPTSVSLNEYIEIAKSYSTPKSSTFINGILAAIVQKIKNENIIFKN
ncbi:MAG: transcription antitermination factor NusB [Fermentimonas sp.]|nr:transcription antitermination factor NusB [Fermentimonas sp.]NLC86994.1 transcription antitermination factor NusB [Bacteroidales bacterium]HBT84975.1 transcription antitermination factor NusB [Porphyromonadaceae bacterium]MDD2930650.1 transcription antitermination factor NusB [Fermentimonas sp.]MDD3188827.1 transcription antitermination factor NusB [Fermentimonas sp.]